MNQDHKKIVGVLGGMGPRATVAFLNTLIDLTPAQRDWDHIQTVTDMDVTIPSRTRHVLYGEASPVPGMIKSCTRLSAYPVDLIVIPCNSACFFIDEVRAEVSTPILNIIDEAVEVLSRISGVRRCAVLGGYVTYTKRTYERSLGARNIEYVEHSLSDQAECERIIEEIKVGGGTSESIAKSVALIDRLTSELNVDAIILGCTEFGCVDVGRCKGVVVDSNRALAMRVVELVAQV